jgi:hypothetical protein
MDQVYVGLDLGSSQFQQVTINASGADFLDSKLPHQRSQSAKSIR